MATLQQKLTALNDALATGAKSIDMDGVKIQYGARPEMLAEVRRLERQISGINRRPVVSSLSNLLGG